MAYATYKNGDDLGDGLWHCFTHITHSTASYCPQTFLYLIGGLERGFYFSIQLGISYSQLTFIFFRGVGIPPTRYFNYPNIVIIITFTLSLWLVYG